MRRRKILSCLQVAFSTLILLLSVRLFRTLIKNLLRDYKDVFYKDE